MCIMLKVSCLNMQYVLYMCIPTGVASPLVTFNLPDVGERIATVEIKEWYVHIMYMYKYNGPLPLLGAVHVHYTD